jgi:hypothetical protein
MSSDNEPIAREMVRVYDFETGEITTIPAAELAPGMVIASIHGLEGTYWIDASKVRKSDYRHPPFGAEVRAYLQRIQDALWEVYPLTFQEWEDGFRRDQDPEREIALWMHLSEVYSRLVAERVVSREAKDDIFSILASCMTSPRENALSLVQLSTLSKAEGELVVDAFYG